MHEHEIDLDAVNSALASRWEVEVGGEMDWETLRTELAKHLEQLITGDFERLVQAMYRLDVDESKFARALSEVGVTSQSKALAAVVLEREVQRIVFRQRYQQQTKPKQT